MVVALSGRHPGVPVKGVVAGGGLGELPTLPAATAAPVTWLQPRPALVDEGADGACGRAWAGGGGRAGRGSGRERGRGAFKTCVAHVQAGSSGTAVQGSSSGTAVQGSSSSGTAVQGSSSSGTAVQGSSSSSMMPCMAVQGSSSGMAVQGSSSGMAVQGSSSGTAVQGRVLQVVAPHLPHPPVTRGLAY